MAELACGICLLEFDTKEGAGEVAKCGHLHVRCNDCRVGWGASTRCKECRVQTVFLTPEQEFWEEAVIAWIRGHYEECYEPAQKALESDPDDVRKNRMAGDLLYEGLGVEKDMEKAKAHYEIAMKGDDEHSEHSSHAAFRIGCILQALMRWEEALPVLEEAEEMGDEDAPE